MSPFQATVDQDKKVALPLEYVKALGLKEGDLVNLDFVPMGTQQKSYKQLEADLGYAEEYEVSVATLKHYIPIWLKNFKANLPHFLTGAKSFADILPAQGGKKKAVCVANGPSMYDTDLKPLAKFKGTVLCTNKPLKHLLEHGVVPDWVCTLDAQDVVLKSFDCDPVKDKADRMNFLLPTTVNPKVVEFIIECAGKDHIYWANPHFGDEVAPNICETLSSITTIPSAEHGGNAGTFAYLMAMRPLYCNPVGLFGYDLSYKPDPKWSLEIATRYRYFYIPELDQVYAMTHAFEYYIARLVDLWQTAKDRLSTRTFNLTPVGPLNAVVGLPRSTLKSFCEGKCQFTRSKFPKARQRKR